MSHLLTAHSGHILARKLPYWLDNGHLNASDIISIHLMASPDIQPNFRPPLRNKTSKPCIPYCKRNQAFSNSQIVLLYVCRTSFSTVLCCQQTNSLLPAHLHRRLLPVTIKPTSKNAMQLFNYLQLPLRSRLAFPNSPFAN